MVAVTPTREDLDPYFTVTWSGMNPGDTGVPFDGLNDTLLSIQGVGGTGDLMASNEDTFTVASTSPNIAGFGGGTVTSGTGLPKMRWYAPFIPSALMQPAVNLILLFKTNA